MQIKSTRQRIKCRILKLRGKRKAQLSSALTSVPIVSFVIILNHAIERFRRAEPGLQVSLHFLNKTCIPVHGSGAHGNFMCAQIHVS